MCRDTYRKIKSSKDGSEVSGLATEVLDEVREITDRIRSRSRVTTVATEDRPRTPPLGGFAPPIGVVDERGLIHE
jgi:hypothetical protein